MEATHEVLQAISVDGVDGVGVAGASPPSAAADAVFFLGAESLDSSSSLLGIGGAAHDTNPETVKAAETNRTLVNAYMVRSSSPPVTTRLVCTVGAST